MAMRGFNWLMCCVSARWLIIIIAVISLLRCTSCCFFLFSDWSRICLSNSLQRCLPGYLQNQSFFVFFCWVPEYVKTVVACIILSTFHATPTSTDTQDLVSQAKVSAAVTVPWCSLPAQSSHRTKPCLECDLVRANSLRVTASLSKCGLLPSHSSRPCDDTANEMRNRSHMSLQSVSWSHRIELSWTAPNKPNGHIRFYWVRYRAVLSDKVDAAVPVTRVSSITSPSAPEASQA